MSRTRFDWTPELSDRARQLRDGGASLRDIGAELGIGKDTVKRHLATLSQPAEQPQAPVSLPLRERVARRNARAFDAMAQLRDAVALVVEERIPQLIVGEPRARLLEAELRRRAATLTALADSFRGLYPDPAPTASTQPTGHDRDLAQH